MTRLLLVAASGLARETLASIRSSAPVGRHLAADGADEVMGFLDDDVSLHGTSVAGLPVLGGLDLAATRTERLLVCAGSGRARAAIVARLATFGVGEERYATHIHPSAVIGDGSTFGAGSIVLAGCVLTGDVTLGRHTVLMPRTVLTHDDLLGDYVTCAAGTTLAGRVHVGSRAYLGMQASVRQDVRVGEDAVIGMGAVVLQDVPDAQTWAGNPAGPLRGTEPAGVVPSTEGALTRLIAMKGSRA
ncbi:acetyltransferase [Citricoccus sp. NPDC079358]|uniref:acetyltransferase n=1 Tax=Citricoccus sp. NPDC079358 TaxID=3154653 RepID=UPI00344C35E4